VLSAARTSRAQHSSGSLQGTRKVNEGAINIVLHRQHRAAADEGINALRVEAQGRGIIVNRALD
jgi:hypothetical protein